MRLKELEEMVLEDSEKLEEIKVRLEQVRVSEQLNQYQIMDGSPFSITIVEARNLPKGSINPYVLVRVTGNEEQKTENAEGTTDPIFS